MLRTGPVALLTNCGAEFLILKTLDEPECSLWKERANDLHWGSLEFFSSYRDRIPGRDYGQSRFAVDPGDVDWSKFDIVISIDIAVPSRITRQFPRTIWAYYIREVKAPSYARSNDYVLPGQDLHLGHGFRLHPPVQPAHVVEFPYHLQYVGWFHELFGGTLDPVRNGLFIDFHTAVMLKPADLEMLEEFGSISSPVNEANSAAREKLLPHRRTIDSDLRERLICSRYFLATTGQRRSFGTAVVEAIAAGCLAIGSPEHVTCGTDIFSNATTATSATEARQRMKRLNSNPTLYIQELTRQRRLVDWLCYTRPLTELLQKAATVQRTRTPSHIDAFGLP
ncbi:MAG: hypothetical protein JSS49_22455 [Planctomycetes bacterium]|nr:hypothetical protein [Planctomycetota bacterium]